METVTSEITLAFGWRDITVYRAGTLAYVDSFGGMIPCTVTEVRKPGYGFIAAPASGEITARINVTRGGYSRGELITLGASDIVPRAQHYYRSGKGRINSGYMWEVTSDGQH